MRIFLSYASEDRSVAEQIQLALTGSGHTVFFDRQSLPAGRDFHEMIRSAVEESDCFVFLISPHSILPGSYARTELKYARAKWSHPQGAVLPVMTGPVQIADVPSYLTAVTILEPEGNVPAEVVLAVTRLGERGASSTHGATTPPSDTAREHSTAVRARRGWLMVGGGLLLAILALTAIYGRGMGRFSGGIHERPTDTPIQRPPANRVRAALVIGNWRYPIGAALITPEADIAEVSGALRTVGFRVRVLPNASKQQILDGWKQVESVASYGGVALLYYAGHGSRHQGDDVILPIDALDSAANGVVVPNLMQELASLDDSLSGASGELILYSTAPGGMAYDTAPGLKTSPFAAAFASAVRRTKGDIREVFQSVSAETKRLSEGRQVPWMSGNFGGRFEFHDESTDAGLGILRIIVFDASRP